jgi:acyl-CoA thioester hydrolase
VNNTVYYEWFDSAVNGWLVEQGLLDIQDGDPIALVVGTRCSYFGSEQAVAQGEFVHVLVDRATRRPVEMPGNWRRALESIS